MSDKVIEVTRDDAARVSTITMVRTDKLNALDDELRNQLSAALASCMPDDGTRVVVLRGSGRAFSVGADVSPGRYISDHGAEADRLRLMGQIVNRCLEIWDAPKPVIAQVHGYCIGIATIYCACCDLVIAAEDAVFGWPKLPLGAGLIGPAWAWSVGMRKAKELSYQVGSELSGLEAERLGFANAAYPVDELDARVAGLAASIARTPADLLRIKKEAFNTAADRQGFREGLKQSAAWDALAHTCASVDETRQLIADLGLKGAIEEFRNPGGLT